MKCNKKGRKEISKLGNKKEMERKKKETKTVKK
jgi:hypothetical protein